MVQAADIHEGMVVRSADGKRVGRVLFVEDRHFIVERGLWTPRDYRIALSDVAAIDRRELLLGSGCELPLEEQAGVLDRLKGFLGLHRRGPAPAAPADSAGPREGMPPATQDVRMSPATSEPRPGPTPEVGTARPTGASSPEDLPVAREPSPGTREVAFGGHRSGGPAPGWCHVEREVITEVKEIEVTLRHERLQVDRRAVPPRPVADAAFEEEEQLLTLYSEEAEIRRRPVPTEEVMVQLVQKEVVLEPHRVDEREISAGSVSKSSAPRGPDEQ